MKDRLSLAVAHILGEADDFTPPNFPPVDVPPGVPSWVHQWASEGLCIDCEGQGYIEIPLPNGIKQMTCRACKGTSTRRIYLNA